MIEERLYSTGNEELDYILEKAFCDGYEYAQKEYAITTRGKINNIINRIRRRKLNVTDTLARGVTNRASRRVREKADKLLESLPKDSPRRLLAEEKKKAIINQEKDVSRVIKDAAIDTTLLVATTSKPVIGALGLVGKKALQHEKNIEKPFDLGDGLNNSVPSLIKSIKEKKAIMGTNKLPENYKTELLPAPTK